MKNNFKRYGLLIVVALAIAACRTQPVYTVDNAPVIVAGLSKQQVASRIMDAAQNTGWTVANIGSDTLRCTNRWRTHVAVVDVHYSASSYSITLVSSENLMQGDGEIHRKYNDRVHALRNAIDKKIGQAF